MAQLLCHNCSRPFTSDTGGDLYCTPVCVQQAAAKIADVSKTMQLSGFVPNPDVPNLWQKADVNISIEQVLREGIDEAVVAHSDALAEIQAAAAELDGGSPTAAAPGE